jgi:hypothetical protein
MSNVGKNLKPTIKPGKEAAPAEKPDKFGQVTSPAGEIEKTHLNSDLDTSQRAQHHTLGKSRNQASPGNHIHDGITSPKIGALKINTSGNDLVPADVLTGAKGGNVALANLITLLAKYINFTDSTT